MNKILGLNLIEVMITLILSSFIIMSLTTIFLAANKNNDAEAAFMQFQDNIDLVSNLLRHAIQQAGWMGCVKQTSAVKIEPYQGRELKPDTEGFTVIGANEKSAVLSESMKNLTTLTVSHDQKFSVNDVINISDCNTTEIFTIKEMQANQVIATSPLNKLYEKHAEVSQFETKSFFIGKTDRRHSDGSLIYALYVKDSNGKSELVEDIVDMQINYAFIDHGILKEAKAKDISDWSTIAGVSIALLFLTPHLKKTVYVYAALRE